jgi:hypothetical protein
MKRTSICLFFSFLFFFLSSFKGYSQQAVLTSSGEKVILNFLPLSGGTISGTLTVSGTATISGSLTLPSLSASKLLGTDGSKGVATGNLSGDITTSGFTATLTNTAVIVGTYGSSTAVPQITVDSKGRITTITTTAITASTATTTIAVFLPTIVIGTQQWMRENLDVLTYRDGTLIGQITNTADWGAATTGAWCYYDNDPLKGAIYGKMYNWYAVNNEDHGGIAPQGWHIPNDAEWTTLSTLLGGDVIAGGKMKSTGFSSWPSPNTSATNESGFSGLPGNYRTFLGSFAPELVGEQGYWWSATEYTLNNLYARYRYLRYNNGNLMSNQLEKKAGLSVRCIRD